MVYNYINTYYFWRSNMNALHACKFYTGRSHLISSLLIQTEQALKDNLMLVYCTEEDYNDSIFSYYKKIIKLNSLKEDQKENDLMWENFNSSVKRETLGNSILINYYNNTNEITSYLNKLYKEACKNGFSGINFCIQMDQVYFMIGNDKLEVLEQNITSAVKENLVSVTCFYDVYKSYKNDVINSVIDIHEYTAYCSNYYKIEEIYK